VNVSSSLERHYSRSATLVAGVGVFATDFGTPPDVLDDRNTVLDLLIEELIHTDDDSSGQRTDHSSSTPSPTAIEPGVSTFAY
jgi:hypothetical protein